MLATPIEQPTIVSVIQFQTTKISQICCIFKSFRPQKSLLRCKAREQSYLMLFSSVSFMSGHITTCLLHFAEDGHFLYSTKRNLMLERKFNVNFAFFQGRNHTFGKDEARSATSAMVYDRRRCEPLRRSGACPPKHFQN